MLIVLDADKDIAGADVDGNTFDGVYPIDEFSNRAVAANECPDRGSRGPRDAVPLRRT